MAQIYLKINMKTDYIFIFGVEEHFTIKLYVVRLCCFLVQWNL